MMRATMTMRTQCQRLFSPLKEIYWRAWYSYVSRADKHNELTFMNYGFQGDEKIALRPEDEQNRYSIQLYEKTVCAIPAPLAEMTLLEVGCGRGGGISYIAGCLKPRHAIGIDICMPAIQFCERHNREQNVSFRCGDAAQLPVADNEVDAVINVESSHRYPDMPQFLREVRRVLKPGGYFAFTDFRAHDAVDALRRQFREAGFEIVEHDTITGQVLRALELDNQRKLDMIERLVPRILHKPAREFASVVDSASYRSLADGHRAYLRFLLRNP